MNTYISMLKGVNVGGNNKIRMDELKKLYEGLGFLNVVTYIQSGNVVFKTKTTSSMELGKKIRKGITDRFGLDIAIILRSVDEMKRIIDNNPFPNAEGNKAYVTFLADTPGTIPSEAINKVKTASESLMISGKEIYVYCPEGYGKSKLSNNFFENKLKVSATSRNLNTIHYLYNLAKEL